MSGEVCVRDGDKEPPTGGIVFGRVDWSENYEMEYENFPLFQGIRGVRATISKYFFFFILDSFILFFLVANISPQRITRVDKVLSEISKFEQLITDNSEVRLLFIFTIIFFL